MGLVNVTGFQRSRRLAAEKASDEARKKKLDEDLDEYANQDGEIEGQGNENKEGNTITPGEEKNATEDQDESKNDELVDDELGKPISPDEVDGMEIETVKGLLEEFGVKFAHNTGEPKLREKLKDAING